MPSGGTLVLISQTQEVAIDFGSFSRPHHAELILLLRDLLPRSIQENWGLFCYGCTHHQKALEAATGRSVVNVTRRRLDWLFGGGMLLAVAATAWSWSVLRSPRMLLMPLPMALIWLVFRFLRPREGYRDYNLLALPPQKRRELLFCLLAPGLFYAPAFPGYFIGRALGNPDAGAFVGIIASLTTSMIVTVVAVRRESRRRAQAMDDEKAPERYLREVLERDKASPK